MERSKRLVAMLLLALSWGLGTILLVLGGAREVRSQTATPGTEARAGREVLLEATIERETAGQVELRLLRMTLEPGGRSPLHTHPGLEFGVVEAGTLSVRVTGPAVLRSAEAEAEEASQSVPIGLDVALGPGDRIAYAPGTGMTFRNPSAEPTTLLAATIFPAGPDAPPTAVFVAGPPREAELAGVRSRILGRAIVPAVPASGGLIVLERLTLRAGDRVPGFPGPVLMAVEEGVVSGSVRAEGLGGTEEMAFRLEPGQSAYFTGGMVETPPLGGEGRVVVLRLGLVVAPAPAPTATAAPTPTATPPTVAAPTPTATATPGPPPGGFAIGSRVVVVVDLARLRGAPSLEGAILAGLELGRVLVVTGEPIAGPEYIWIPVQDVADPSLVGFVASVLLAPEMPAS